MITVASGGLVMVAKRWSDCNSRRGERWRGSWSDGGVIVVVYWW